MHAYYNEIDPYAAQWLRNLIAAGHIASGDVDERNILEVKPDDLRGYTQCHFFAGIGGWSYALRLAGWADDRPVWTGSCPCQPFSTAGTQRGSDDERHLWPAFFDLIRQCSPASVFGEQVAGAAGLAWLDHVCADLEGAGYAAAAADLPACSVGATHRRQRLWWVAGLLGNPDREQTYATVTGQPMSGKGRAGSEWVADATSSRLNRSAVGQKRGEEGEPMPGKGSGMGNAHDAGLEGRRDHAGEHAGQLVAWAASPWRDLEWLTCSDGKARPTQPGLFPLAHGVPNRVGRLRAYGNAIVPQVASSFIMACMY